MPEIIKTNENAISSEQEKELQLEYIKKASLLLSSYEKMIGHKPTACVTTFGCQMNI